MRKNNPAEMTITEQFEVIKEQICDEYCRFPELSRETHEDPDDAFEWMQHTYCEHCPLMRL